MKARDYEFNAKDGKWHMLMFGQRHRGFHPYDTEAAVKQAIADAAESNRQADEDESRFHIQ